jgi:Trypsin-like peptidase domain/CHAT domain
MGNGATATAAVDPIVRDEFLPACTVRVHIGDEHAGTGFFAAPGCVVTCEHVMRTLLVMSGDSMPDVTVVDMQRREYRMVDRPETSRDDDLAVLRVEPAHGHACALLAAGLNGGDDVVTFGAPAGDREGVPTELRAEGTTKERSPKVKLSTGQVRPGMSGSPVLNLRTGGVCGVLSLTRDETQALGGYAVPIQALFRLSPTLERNNLRFHEADPTWFKALPREQRQLMPIGRRAAPSSAPLRFFVVTVRQSEFGWKASAVEHPDGGEIADIDVDLRAVRQHVARVFRYWARRGRGDPTDETRRLGSILAAVLPDGIRTRLDELVADSAGPVELVLRFDEATDPDLVFLPWENLFLERAGMAGDVFIARADRPTFVRALGREVREPTPAVRRGLDVLLIEVDPTPAPAQGDGDEDAPPTAVGSVCDALVRMAELREPLHVDRIKSPTPTEIAATLRESAYDVVHYVGHGRFVPGEAADELALGGSGDSAYADAPRVQAALTDSPPALVVMQVCDVPDDLMPADLSTFGPPLLANEGTGAVVAYQFPVGARRTKEFNKELYPRLLAGESVGAAVQAARRALWLANGRSRAFVSPATLLRQPGEFRLTAGSGMATTLSRTSALTSYA